MLDILLILSFIFCAHYTFTDSVSSLSFAALALVLHVALIIFGPRSRREMVELKRSTTEIRGDLVRMQNELNSLRNKGEIHKWKA